MLRISEGEFMTTFQGAWPQAGREGSGEVSNILSTSCIRGKREMKMNETGTKAPSSLSSGMPPLRRPHLLTLLNQFHQKRIKHSNRRV